MPLDSPERKVILRPMTLADLDQVVLIDRSSFPTPWPEDAFRYEIVRKKNSVCWVAERKTQEKDSGIIASIVIWLADDKGHVGTIAVKPGWRRQGIGQYLLAHALIACFRRGAKQVLLEVRESNRAAHALYQKIGFKEVGLRQGYYQDTHEDAILMRLASINHDKLADLAKTE